MSGPLIWLLVYTVILGIAGGTFIGECIFGETNDWDTEDKVIISIALIIWPISLVIFSGVLIKDNLWRLPTYRRKLIGRYWNLRAKLANEDEIFRTR